MTATTVYEVMTSEVVSVRDDAPFQDIAEALGSHRISAVPVVDADDRVIGVVSQTDLLYKLQFAGDSPLRRITHRTAARKAAGRTAHDVMTHPAVTVPAHTPVVTAAKMMQATKVKRLPVVDEVGHLIGIVSQGDLLSVFLRSDREIFDEVVKEVLVRQMWIQPTDVSVTVEHGVVELVGQVERKSAADLTLHLVRGVDGVVDVVDKLTYRTDDTKTVPTAEYYGGPA